jgi:hypothetical protein
MAVFVDALLLDRVGQHIRASLDGIAVGTLLDVPQPAAWTKPHGATAPGKISFTHNQ